MKVKAKTIVVTGAGSGIGRELTLCLLDRGASVAAVDLSEPALKETSRLVGADANLSVHVLNITDRDAVARLPEQVVARHGVIDGVINNAGIIQPFARVADLDMATIDRIMGVNFFGTVAVTKALLPYLLRRPEAHIVNISSMGGFLPVPGQTVYGASKAAVKLFTEGLHSELQGTPVRVTVVFPGATRTNIAANSGVDTPILTKSASKRNNFKMLEPEKAARIIVDAVERNAYRVTVGPDSTFFDAFSRISPERAARFIAKQMRDLLPH